MLVGFLCTFINYESSKGGGTIFVTPVAIDKHGSTVAELFVLLGNKKALLLNSQMIADGYAWHEQKYSRNCPSRKGLVLAGNEERDWLLRSPP